MSPSVAITVGAIIAFGMTIFAFVAIIPEERREALSPFLRTLHDIFNLRNLLSEKILKVLYVFNTILCETAGFFLLFAKYEIMWTSNSTWMYGLLLIVVGPIACRLLHESLMVFILTMKNTNDINQKLTKLYNDISSPDKDVTTVYVAEPEKESAEE